MIFDEIKKIPSSEKDLKKFGITIGLLLVIVSLWMILKNYYYYPYFSIGGLLFIVFSYTFPVILKPIQKLWMTLGIIMGWLSTRIILSLLFYVILTPIGLIMKFNGKDPLERQRNGDTYWHLRNDKTYNKEQSEKQF